MKKMAKAAALIAAMVLAAGLSACHKKAFAQEGGASGTAKAAKPTPVNEFSRELTEDGSGVRILKYNGSDKAVVIPSEIEGLPVKAIGYSAFYNCSGTLKSVTIPDSVEEIGDNAFNGCGSLQSVTLGKSLQKISSYAFNGCTSLNSLTIPDSLQEIEFYRDLNVFWNTELPLATQARLKALGTKAVSRKEPSMHARTATSP